MKLKINKGDVCVVVGATTNREKYGYRVLMRLKELGYKVVGVNPKYEEVEGVKCYRFLSELIDSSALPQNDKLLVITVVPPEVTEMVVEECGRLEVRKMWMQVGSGSDKAEVRAKELGIEVLGTDCIIVDGLGQSW